MNNKEGISHLLINLGTFYIGKNDHTKALDNYFKSLKLSEEIGDKEYISSSLTNIALTYAMIANTQNTAFEKQKNYTLAQSFSQKALSISRQIGYPKNIRYAEQTLSKIDSALGNFKSAFEHYKQYIIYRDSINNESTRKASIRNQLNYEFEKKEAIIKEQQEKERVIANEKSRFQKIIIASVLLGFLLVVFFAFYIYHTLKLTKYQKHIIEEKQNEIISSIRYAKRIQTSLLPTQKYIEKKINKNINNN